MSRMQVALLSTALVGCLVVAGSPNASAGPINLSRPGFSAVIDPFQLTFNESGNGSYVANGLAAIISDPGVVILDTSQPGSGRMALVYMLPQAVVAGTVVIDEPVGSGGFHSEVIRFTDAAGTLSGITGVGPRLVYYSDFEASDATRELADTGFPLNITIGTVLNPGAAEIGFEGSNGFTYSPGAAYPANNVYIARSDDPPSGVPEPSTLALFGAGLLALGLIGRRRKRPAQAA